MKRFVVMLVRLSSFNTKKAILRYALKTGRRVRTWRERKGASREKSNVAPIEKLNFFVDLTI